MNQFPNSSVSKALKNADSVDMRVLLINDHPLFDLGVKLLDIDVDQIVCSCMPNAFAATNFVGPFDLILLGVHHPDVAQVAHMDVVRKTYPDTPVSVVSASVGRDVIDQALSTSAACRVPRAAAPDLLVRTLRLVLSGHQAMSADYFRPVTTSSSDLPTPYGTEPVSLLHLTERQKDILRQVAQGSPNKAIARHMGIAEATVKSHISSIFRTLKVHNRTAAVLAARRLGLTIPTTEATIDDTASSTYPQLPQHPG